MSSRHQLLRRSCWTADVDGIFLSNGPGDPAAVEYAIENVRDLTQADKPIFGICLGHQILGLALGGKTFKLKFGHRGANHPVKFLETGKVEITSQNHGFAVDPESLPPDVKVTHLNLYDGTVEGLRVMDRPIYSVQYHPEASPGPHDADYLFKQFVEDMERDGNASQRRPQADSRDRRRPDRDWAGVRVRLFRHAGVQGAAFRRPRSHPRQQQPGDDHDRPGDGRSDLHRAAHGRGRHEGHRKGTAGRASCRPSAGRPR